MKAHAVPRWAISLADIMMLLLGFFILLQAGKATDVAAGARAAFSMEPQPRALLTTEAAALFEPGEARLRPTARARLASPGSISAISKGR